MLINYVVKGPLNYFIIDNFYEPEELKIIKQELNELLPFIKKPKYTGAAKGKKKGLGLFLDDHYIKNRNESNILYANRKLFDTNFVNELKKFNCWYDHISYCNSDTTLINFYKDKDYYKSHHDANPLTAITFFSIGTFKGGNFKLTEYDEEIECIENRMIIFAGSLLHEALPLEVEKDNYRVSMVQFCSYKPFKHKY